MNRRTFLSTAASGAALSGLACGASDDTPSGDTRQSLHPKRPNILIVMCDQLSWKALPAYGNTYAATPNIDRIMNRGVRFSRCYAACALCQPTRPSIWTGRFPHNTGILSNGRRHYVPTLSRRIPTLGDIFSAAGYDTMHFGKTHDAGSLRGFTVEKEGEVEIAGTDAWPVNYDTFRDRYTTPRVVEYLKGGHDRPFLAVADLNNPHNICGWVGHNQGPHEDVPVQVDLPPLPGNFRDRNFEKKPLPVQYICCSHNRLAQAARWNETNYRHYLAAYHHYLDLVDADIGLILDALESRGDADNTLIVFMADHGDGMGAHRMVTKQVSFIEETTRVPLAFAGFGVQGEGTLLESPLVSHVDLLPTLCDFAGLDAPDGLWGASLMSWIEGRRDGSPHDHVVTEWHTEWAYTVSPGRMVRTDRHKYTHYLEGDGEELYDLDADPGETLTLADEPAYSDILDTHRKALRAHLDETVDPFFDLAWKADPRWRNHEPGYRNHRGPAAPMVEG